MIYFVVICILPSPHAHPRPADHLGSLQFVRRRRHLRGALQGCARLRAPGHDSVNITPIESFLNILDERRRRRRARKIDESFILDITRESRGKEYTTFRRYNTTVVDEREGRKQGEGQEKEGETNERNKGRRTRSTRPAPPAAHTHTNNEATGARETERSRGKIVLLNEKIEVKTKEKKKEARRGKGEGGKGNEQKETASEWAGHGRRLFCVVRVRGQREGE